MATAQATAPAPSAAANKSSSKGQAWFCSTGLPSDTVVEVEDMTFHLHKFPLKSKSRKLHFLITQAEANNLSSSSTSDLHVATTKIQEEEEDYEIEDNECHCHIVLSGFPSGSETFEIVAKFCYGIKIELNSSNVIPLRIAGEFLEMTENSSNEDNLIAKTEKYLSQTILRSVKESIKALKSCELVMNEAEVMGIKQKCIDTIASRAGSADLALFGWPLNDGANGATRGSTNQTWFEDLSVLNFPLFKRLISAMRDRDLNSETIESCLIFYAKRHIPGISRSSRRMSFSSSTTYIATETDQKDLLEFVINNLPLEKSSGTSTATRLLSGLLRTANILNVSESCKSALEKKISLQLDQATLDDLLIPSYSYLNETLYDVDCVARILAFFLDRLQESNDAAVTGPEQDGDSYRSASIMLVGKLIDRYLSEIASDANLKPEKFYDLANALPEQARLFDDGLYRAVDVYLRAHSLISEADREKISRIVDCQKLTLEACTHAAQNECLPLRSILQVLFFEQLQLRNAIAGTLLADAAAAAALDPGRLSTMLRRSSMEEEEEGEEVNVNKSTWRAAVSENQVLRMDMDSMRTRVHQLERECSTMKKVIQEIGKVESQAGDWRWRRLMLTNSFGCMSKIQVCNSHESTVLERGKGRRQKPQP